MDNELFVSRYQVALPDRDQIASFIATQLKDEAREILLPVYTWLSEGLDTEDLKEARSLFDELAPSGSSHLT